MVSRKADLGVEMIAMELREDGSEGRRRIAMISRRDGLGNGKEGDGSGGGGLGHSVFDHLFFAVKLSRVTLETTEKNKNKFAS